ncbi:MAG: DUF1592 domain-containing protein [Isosphaeraceae bacterium]
MLPPRISRTIVVAAAALALAPASRAAEPDTLRENFDQRIRPILRQFCVTCHSAEKHKGDLNLEAHATAAEFRRDAELLEKIADALDHGEMPPKESPQLAAAERDRLRRWLKDSLDAEAASNPGDPGPAVVRRLTNFEYTNTVRALTGLDLDPAREFPADSAAGEGFTNVSAALAMSPALLDKYLAAAKSVAAHVVLLPDGFRFSEKVTRPDWTEEILSEIKRLYARYTDPRGAEKVQLQGLVWESKGGGQIPLESYLAATLAYRDGKAAGRTLADLAREQRLSPRYLGLLWDELQKPSSSVLLEQVRRRWREARPGDEAAVAAMIRRWQGELTRFKSVGHFKPWQETVNPIEESHAFRTKLEPAPGASEVALRLSALDAGDGHAGDLVEWQAPRLEAPGRPTILLKDLQATLRVLEAKRRKLAEAAKYLALADALRSRSVQGDARTLAAERGLDADLLAAWLDLLGIAGAGRPATLEALFTNRMERGGGYEFIKSWGSPATPSVTANSSDQQVRIPGIMKPHGVAVHPSPTRNVGIAWRSPLDGPARIEARVAHAHPECGNGLTWALERRRSAERRRLRAGEIDTGKAAKIEPVGRVELREGDLVCLVVGPRGDHSCDLTEVDLTVEELSGGRRRWNLGREVSGDLLAANPHPDAAGRKDVWSFFHENGSSEDPSAQAELPAGSLLDRWLDEPDAGERARLARQLQGLLAEGAGPAADPADRTLVARLRSLGGPLLGRIDATRTGTPAEPARPADASSGLGSLTALFGKGPGGRNADPTSLIVQAPAVIEVHVPADLAAGREFAVTAALAAPEGAEGTAQVQVLVDGPASTGAIAPGSPILARNGSDARTRIVGAFEAFRRLFPAALCYSQIVPVDEVVTLALYHREDDNLARLMLDEPERRKLDRLWDELGYISQEALKVEVGYVQFMEYTTQDSDPNLFKPLARPIKERADALRRRLKDSEARHLEELQRFTRRAYRRPLADAEKAGLTQLHGRLRAQGLEHDEAFRLTLARVLVAPDFLYQVELSRSGTEPQPVSPWELASRLSYFLWSSPPDEELERLASEGKLQDPQVLAAQLQRMLADRRARALATEFACQWIDIRNFDSHDEKSERVFPEFAGLRGAMYEEAVLFFADLFRSDGSLLEVLDTDHTFVNEALAKFYGIPGVAGAEWRRVDGVRKNARGGVLAMAALLSKQSGASRTSPILRGNWLLEMLLGEKLPKPPKNVPQLPDSELDTGGLTLRQITEKHRSIESCAKCHDRIDPFGFALEKFDAIGRRREADQAGRPIDTNVTLPDGSGFEDLAGLKDYLLRKRREEFVRQFCRKLLGYALGRSVQLSDRPLLESMEQTLAADGYHVQGALLAVVRSPQFRLRRALVSN